MLAGVKVTFHSIESYDPKSNASISVEEKIVEFLIDSKNQKKYICEIIIDNFYAILKNNEYLIL